MKILPSKSGQIHLMKGNKERGEEARAEDKPITELQTHKQPDSKYKALASGSEDADSDAFSEDSMPRDIHFTGAQPQSQACISTYPFTPCDLCLGDVRKATLQVSPAKRFLDPVALPELRVMLLGRPGAGKSASGNTILGREAFKAEVSAGPVTKYCETGNSVVGGKNITVIDTPGFMNGRLDSWKERVDTYLHSSDHSPLVFLLVIPVGTFTENNDVLKHIRETLGEEALKFTTVLFTRGDQLDGKSVEMFLSENALLKDMVGSVGGGYNVFSNKLATDLSQVETLIQKIESLLWKNAGYSCVNEREKGKMRQEQVKRQVEQQKLRYYEKRLMEKSCHAELENNQAQRMEDQRELKENKTMGNVLWVTVGVFICCICIRIWKSKSL